MMPIGKVVNGHNWLIETTYDNGTEGSSSTAIDAVDVRVTSQLSHESRARKITVNLLMMGIYPILDLVV